MSASQAGVVIRGVRVAVAVLTFIAVVSPATQRNLDAQQAPIFRSTSDLVTVDVTVRRRGEAVRGLGAADFVLTDNGVTQRVEMVETSAMPVDVTVIVDVSRGTGVANTTRLTAAALRAQVQENAAAIVSILRPADRIEILTSEAYVTQLLPMQPVADVQLSSLDQPPSALGLASTYDALVTAMLRRSEPERRHLVVAWVKPVDTASIADASVVREIATRTDVVVHVVERDLARRLPFLFGSSGDLRPMEGWSDSAVSEADAEAAGSPPIPTMPTAPLPPMPRAASVADLEQTDTNGGRYLYRLWRPAARVEPALLPELAVIGGGTHRGIGVWRDPSVAGEFREIFDEFRQGYVLRYRPEGVRREGTHTIAVTVPRYADAEIRARRGYTIEPASRARTAAPEPSRDVNSPLQTVEELADLFRRTDERAFQASVRPLPNLRRLIRAYRDGGTPLPANPRLDALLALEVSTAGIFGAAGDAMEDAEALLVRQFALVRDPIEPDAFECGWYRAANALLQAGHLATTTLRMTDEAIARCPTDGRLHLARAIATDQLWSLPTAGRGMSRETAGAPDANAVLSGYEDVMRAFPEAAPEARVRAAWAAFRDGRHEQAMDLLSAVPSSTGDTIVDYFHYLVRGQVLRRLDRPVDAANAYRAALAAWPGAQSARVGLMTLLVEHGQRTAAEDVSEAVQTAPQDRVDPWWAYWQGDYRSFSAQVRQLRELAR